MTCGHLFFHGACPSCNEAERVREDPRAAEWTAWQSCGHVVFRGACPSCNAAEDARERLWTDRDNADRLSRVLKQADADARAQAAAVWRQQRDRADAVRREQAAQDDERRSAASREAYSEAGKSSPFRRGVHAAASAVVIAGALIVLLLDSTTLPLFLFSSLVALVSTIWVRFRVGGSWLGWRLGALDVTLAAICVGSAILGTPSGEAAPVTVSRSFSLVLFVVMGAVLSAVLSRAPRPNVKDVDRR